MNFHAAKLTLFGVLFIVLSLFLAVVTTELPAERDAILKMWFAMGAAVAGIFGALCIAAAMIPKG